MKETSISCSLSVILPAHNEEEVIATTVHDVIDALSKWMLNYEVIVVDDGSQDHTGAILDTIAIAHPCLKVIHHPVNRGYGAALVSGFEAVTKDLVFFMDADGQFDIHDLERFFPLIEEYDAVLGYRVDRQDTHNDRWVAGGQHLIGLLPGGIENGFQHDGGSRFGPG